MDLCAQMLWAQLQTQPDTKPETKPDAKLTAVQICPPFQRRWQRIPKFGQQAAAFNADRLLNRLWDYPQWVKPLAPEFDYFHVCDHSYAAIVHGLPAARTGVYCHDIDAFRSLVTPELEPRPAWYRAMSRRILTGLQKAALVFYSTEAVRQQILEYGLIAPDRLVQAPLGISPEYTRQALISDPQTLAQFQIQTPYLLHVGSCIPRKRVDVLLAVFAQLRQHYPTLQLVKVSGDWTAEQQSQIEQGQLTQDIVHLHNLERQQIAALYRQAALVLLPSESEGFGLPVIEALACGATVIASDIPVLREVGGDAVIYCPVAAVDRWVATITQLLEQPTLAPTITTKQVQAERYSWQTHAQIIAQAYLKLI
jgi:glycosyltransferase involved in cell wall biosynthesis